MKHIFSLLLITIVLAGCGIKRPLELPGHEKHKETPTVTVTPPQDSQPSQTPGAQTAPSPAVPPGTDSSSQSK